MSWLCQLVEELQDRLLRVEQLLDFLDVRAGRTARLVGGNWEVSDQQIAQWVPGTTLPLGNSSSYVRFKDGSLEIRGGQFRTGESGAHMTLDSSNMKGYNTNGNLTIDLDWTTGTIWAKSGGFGGTSGSPVIVLDDASANVFVPQPIYLGSDANGLVVGGQTAGGVPYIESTNYSAGSTGWRIDNDGNAEFNNVTVRGTIYASGGEISGGLAITSGGYIKAGTGTKDVDLNGIQIDSAELVGQSGGTDQVRIGADGKLYAGTGMVTLDEDGLILGGQNYDQAEIKWSYEGDYIGRMGAYHSGSGDTMNIQLGDQVNAWIRDANLSALNSYESTMLSLRAGQKESTLGYIKGFVSGFQKLGIWPEETYLYSPLKVQKGITYQRVANPTFTSSDDWTWGTGWSWDTDRATHTTGYTAALEQNVSVVAGATYYLTYDIVISAGSVTVELGGVSGQTRSSTDYYEEYITVTGTGNLKFVPSSDFDGSILSISVQKITPPDVYIDGSIKKSTAIGCQLRRNSTQLIPNNSHEPIKYNVTPADWDPWSMWTWKSGGESKIYPKVKGRYRIRASVGWDANAGGGRRIISIRLNGSVWIAQQTLFPGGNSCSQTVVGETPELDPENDDYIEIYAYQDSGASINIRVATTSNLMNNTVTVTRIP